MIDIIASQRDQFWRQLDAQLMRRGAEPATNGEIENVIRRTTCPRQAAEFVERMRTGETLLSLER